LPAQACRFDRNLPAENGDRDELGPVLTPNHGDVVLKPVRLRGRA
jgi:hypothetical protein